MPELSSPSPTLCSVDNCGKKIHSKGYCQAHYRLFKKYGIPEVLPKEKRKKPGPKPLPKVDMCSRGHLFEEGSYSINARGHRICKQCREGSWKDFCPQGHPYEGDNLYVDSRGYFHCRTCRRDRMETGRAEGRFGRFKDFNLTPEKYEEMLTAQNHACAVCERPFSSFSTQPAIDHDHSCCPEKGKSCGRCIRGILCRPCNAAIGAFNDDPDILRKAADYLLRGGGPSA